MQAFALSDRLADDFLTAAADALKERGDELDTETCLADPLAALEQLRVFMRQTGPASTTEPRVMAVRPNLCVLWKPSGWTVSVVKHENEEAVVEEGAAQGQGEPLQSWLTYKMEQDAPIVLNVGVAHGLIHRLDQGTSGALLWAYTYRGFYAARLQFAAKRVCKEYVCLSYGMAPPGLDLLDAPLLTPAHGPLRSVVSASGRPACTEIRKIGHLQSANGVAVSLIELRLHTGRLHQVRVHLSNQGHPLLGDCVYGNCAMKTGPEALLQWNPPRLLLHARSLRIDIGDGPLEAWAPFSEDMLDAFGVHSAFDAPSRALLLLNEMEFP